MPSNTDNLFRIIRSRGLDARWNEDPELEVVEITGGPIRSIDIITGYGEPVVWIHVPDARLGPNTPRVGIRGDKWRVLNAPGGHPRLVDNEWTAELCDISRWSQRGSTLTIINSTNLSEKAFSARSNI